MPHVVLLGDSIFDNAAYVGGGPDVVTHLRGMLRPGWRASLLAVDGAVIDDVGRQLDRIPPEATHLVLSAGGNDALGHAGLLDRQASSSGEVLAALADATEGFARRYARLVDRILALGRPLTLCTIYEGNLGAPVQRLAAVALAAFDDRIVRIAASRRLPVIELRLVCTLPGDYANPIEPSVGGGEKIAAAILHALVERRPDARHAEIFGDAALPPAPNRGG